MTRIITETPEPVAVIPIVEDLEKALARNRPAFPLQLADDLSGLADEEVAGIIVARLANFPPERVLRIGDLVSREGWKGIKG